MADNRHRYISQIVQDAFDGLRPTIIDSLLNENNALCEQFFAMDGPRTLYFLYQPDLVTNDAGEQVPTGANELSMSAELPLLFGTAVYSSAPQRARMA